MYYKNNGNTKIGVTQMTEIVIEKILSKKVLKLEASPTFALDAKANEIDVELKKQGDYVVRFGIGQPDFNTPENIKEAGKKAIDDNKTVQSRCLIL